MYMIRELETYFILKTMIFSVLAGKINYQVNF
jgi:hypothetical protein